MKDFLNRFLGVGIVVCFIATSCTEKKPDAQSELATDSIRIEKTEHLKSDTSKAACQVNLNFTFVKEAAEESLKDSINQTLLRELFGLEYEHKEVAQALDSFVTAYIATYKKEMNELLSMEPEFVIDENSGAFNYSQDLICRMIYNNHGIITFRASVYEYTGGAHGNSNSFLFNFTQENGKCIRLQDIFTPGYEDHLNDLLLQQLLKDNKVGNVKDLEELGYFITSPIFPSENFYFKGEDIVFLYNPYEIAPYAMGSTEIELPLSEIQFLIKEKSPIENLTD